MADFYFLSGNTNSGGSWSFTSGGSAAGTTPTSTDNIFFDSNSGNGNINNNLQGDNINFTGYSSTLTYVSGSIGFVSSLTLTAGMTISGACPLNKVGTTTPGTLTSNGFAWPGNLNPTPSGNNSNALTFTDDFTLLGDLSSSFSGILHGNVIVYVHGDISLPNGMFDLPSTGLNLVMKGSSTTIQGRIGCNIDFDPGVGNTISGGSTLDLNLSASFSIRVISGTLDVTGTDLTISGASTTLPSSFDLNGAYFKSILFAANNGTINLDSDIIFGSYINNANVRNWNGSNIYIDGNCVIGFQFNGTSQLVLTGGTIAGPGGGTYTFSSTTSPAATGITSNLTVDCDTSTYNFSNFNIRGTFNIVSGTINHSGVFNVTGDLTFNNSETVTWDTIRLYPNSSSIGKVTNDHLITANKLIVNTASTVQGFYGIFGFAVDDLEIVSPASNINFILRQNVTYLVNNNFYYERNTSGTLNISSQSATDRAILTVDPGATVQTINTVGTGPQPTITRIDSGSGQRIMVPDSFILIDTIYWNHYYDFSPGGGGAIQVGGNAVIGSGGDGGDGLTTSITGPSLSFGGGGGGGAHEGTAGTGGLGGGANGTVASGSATGNNGTVNTGGGGGGVGYGTTGQNGGNGGKGIIIIAYQISP